MLIIECYLKEIELKGISLFTKHSISKGDIIWKFEDNFHKLFSIDEVNTFSPLLQQWISKYSTSNFHKVGYWFLDLDDTRFMNHSETPNIVFKGDYGYALVDIKAGKELTCDYRTLGDTEDIDFTKYI